MKILSKNNIEAFSFGCFFILLSLIIILVIKERKPKSDLEKLIGKEVIILLEFDDSEDQDRFLWEGKIKKIDDSRIEITEVHNYDPSYRNTSFRGKYRKYNLRSDNLANANN